MNVLMAASRRLRVAAPLPPSDELTANGLFTLTSGSFAVDTLARNVTAGALTLNAPFTFTITVPLPIDVAHQIGKAVANELLPD